MNLCMPSSKSSRDFSSDDLEHLQEIKINSIISISGGLDIDLIQAQVNPQIAGEILKIKLDLLPTKTYGSGQKIEVKILVSEVLRNSSKICKKKKEQEF